MDSSHIASALCALVFAWGTDPVPFQAIAQGTSYSRSTPEHLRGIRPAILKQARDQPQVLLDYIVHPDTPLVQAIMAAQLFDSPLRVGKDGLLRAGNIGWLARARIQLRDESGLHHFGLKPGSNWSIPGRPDNKPWYGPDWATMKGTVRTVLGREWRVPATRIDWPETWEAASAAPWPWRAQEALLRLEISMVACRGYGDSAHAWLEECSKLPREEPFDARVYVEATLMARHLKTLEVLANWRKIILDPRCLQGALQIGHSLSEVARRSIDPEVHLACRVLAADLLSVSPHVECRRAVTLRLATYLEPNEGSVMRATRLGALPSGAVLAAIRLYRDAVSEDYSRTPWYHMAAIGKLMDEPRFRDGDFFCQGAPERAALLSEFDAWLPSIEPLLAAGLAAERTMRAKLIAFD